LAHGKNFFLLQHPCKSAHKPNKILRDFKLNSKEILIYGDFSLIRCTSLFIIISATNSGSVPNTKPKP
jgi:hypothetical protein